MTDGAQAIAPVKRDDLAPDERLRITEIFLSIQGESATVGWPTVFVRLSGCPLRCRWCDTAYAFHGGSWLHLDQLERTIADYAVRHVCITGGEPLAQPNTRALVTRLAEKNYSVSIETSGALPIAGLDPRATVVMDVKAPGSGEVERNLPGNLEYLRAKDQVKFVLADRRDYEWARTFTVEHSLAARTEVLFSPVANELAPRSLAEWILDDRLPVRLQVQLHKLLWGDVPGR